MSLCGRDGIVVSIVSRSSYRSQVAYLHIDHRHPDMVCTFEICIQNAKVPDSFDPGYFEVLGIYAIVYKAHLVRFSISHRAATYAGSS